MRRSNLPTLVFLIRSAMASPYLKRMVGITTTTTTGLNEMTTTTTLASAEHGSSEFLSKLVISVFLVLAGGVFAG